MRLLLFLTVCWLASAAEPVVSAWIMARPVENAELRKSLPDVHEVIVKDEYVEVRSAGLSLMFLGPFQNPLTADGGVRDLRFRIPRKPVPQDGLTQSIGSGPMGVFLNGVPLYNRFADASYLGRNMWHFDMVAFNDPTHPSTLGVLQSMISNKLSHSPLLGFALDGFPIYGPWAFDKADGTGGFRRMRSGYRLRNIRERTTWPDGTQLTPSQYGPPVNLQVPLGTFAEDYEYKPQTGDLDESNGRFCVTPDYPLGTYAYFLSTDDLNDVVFPYFMTGRFHGRLLGVSGHASGTQVQFASGKLETGSPVELRFAFPGAKSLEIVHERPLHLMVVSKDLRSFEHIHPQWKLGGWYAIDHIFTKPGKYRLFAQFTLPGAQERVETFDIEVTGSRHSSSSPAPPVKATLRKPTKIHTGEDILFTADLSGQPIEPFLGAWGHFVFLDQNLSNFIHVHPNDGAATSPDPRRPHIHGVSDAPVGPPPSAVSFTTNFSAPGKYKLWTQFQVAGQAVVIPFNVEVTASAKPLVALAASPAGAIPVKVDSHGFTPARIDLKADNPSTLAFSRSATPNCGSQVVFPALGIKRDLPLGQITLIEIPKLTGTIEFACGMGMFRGVIVAVTQP